MEDELLAKIKKLESYKEERDEEKKKEQEESKEVGSESDEFEP